MAKRKRGGGGGSAKSTQERELKRLTEIVTQTTHVFTCPTDACIELAELCNDAVEDAAIVHNAASLASEIWSPIGTDIAKPIADAARELLAEYERHTAALIALRDTFAALSDSDNHEHLEPAAKYAEIVIKHMAALNARDGGDDD